MADETGFESWAAAFAAFEAEAKPTEPEPEPTPTRAPDNQAPKVPAPIPSIAAYRAGAVPGTPPALAAYPAPTRYGQCSRCGGPNDNPEAANGAAFCLACTAVLAAAPPAPLPPLVAQDPTPEELETFLAPPVAPTPAPPGPASLSQTAMIVDFTRTGWGAAKIDRDVTKDVLKAAGAGSRSGHFYKKLLPENAPVLKRLRAAIQDAYEDHRNRTAPWMDDGSRILASTGYEKYAEVQREHQRRIATAKDEFRREYQDLKDQARQSLGSLFNEDDYPTADEVLAKFAAGYRAYPIPETSDFRMAVGDAERARLQTEYQAAADEVISGVRQTIAQRITAEVGHILDRMQTYDGTQTGSFRDTLIENARALAEVLPSLNVTNDPEVTALADRIERELTGADVATLRKNPAAREALAKSAESILADVSAFIA